MAEETIFSKIIRREIPAKIVYENEHVLAFHDISPRAPTHILVIPRKGLVNLTAAVAEDKPMLGELLFAVSEIARKLGVEQSGYRVVINNGSGAGQTVFHLHLHILAGREFQWPPG